jgi:hypothetical protein
MTREEAKITLEKICSEAISDTLFEREGIALEEFVDKIYNSFKSRTCASCKHYNDFNESSGLCENIKITFIDAVDNDFGCNKWRKK